MSSRVSSEAPIIDGPITREGSSARMPARVRRLAATNSSSVTGSTSSSPVRV